MTARRPRAFGLAVEPEHLPPPERYPFGLEGGPDAGLLTGHARRLIALARALTTSAVWQEMDEAVLVVRTEPPAGLAFLGRFSAEESARLQWLPAQLRRQLPHFRHVPWRQVETDVEELASRLVARLGRREVRDMQFEGIPRGGVIVLGLLAYALDLDPSRLAADEDARRPLVLVDDCALSGLRFGEVLRARASGPRSVVFAHLYSHPDLRRIIEDREPQVIAAIAAQDLQDLAPQQQGDELDRWRSRWATRGADDVYWVGNPEHLAFPWSEPDCGFWDESMNRVRLGWRLAPPGACLKNRATAGAGASRLQIQSSGQGLVTLAPRTFHAELDGRVIVAELESGQVVCLAGVAADLWREFLGAADPEVALDRVLDRYQTTRDVLREDARDFWRELRTRGLVTTIPALQERGRGGDPDV
jgi:hypothetical protein